MKSKDNGESIDVKAIFDACLKKWYIFAVTIGFCVACAIVYVQIHNEEYAIKANMLISEPDDNLASSSPIGSIFGSSANVHDELYSISSHTVLMDVARQMGLERRHDVKDGLLHRHFAYRDYPVDVVLPPQMADTLRMALIFKIKVDKNGLVDCVVRDHRKNVLAEVEDQRFPVEIKTDIGNFTLVPTEYFVKGESLKTNISVKGYDAVAEALAEDIVIDVANRRANIIELEMNSDDIDYARDILNLIIEKYNDRALGMTNVQNRQTLEFLNSRLELLASDLTDVEGSLENLKTSKGVTDLRAEVEYQFTKKGKIEEELIAAETQYEISKLILDFVSDPANAHNLIPSGLVTQTQSETTGNSVNGYNNLLLRRMRLVQTASEDNVTVRTIDGQLDALRANLITTLQKSLETSGMAVKELKAKYSTAQAALGNVPGQERAFRDIIRQQSIKEQLYVHLLKQRESVSMMLANSRPKGVVIDSAYALKDSVGMSKKVILILAFVIGALLGALIVYMMNVFRTKFSDRHELESLTDAPILGEMCVSRSGQSLVVSEGGSSTASELFRLIRLNLLFVLGSENNKVVLMTSTKSGEGKSFIAINLASSLALLGKKVLLVGMDIRNPQLANYLSLKHNPGITEYLSSDRYTIGEITQTVADNPNLDVIVAGPIPPNPAELISSTRVDELFAKLRSMYDYIIVDSAPVGVISDSFSLARISDATIYVCRANFTTKSDINYFNSLYDEHRLSKPALVLNGTAAKQGYGYGKGDK